MHFSMKFSLLRKVLNLQKGIATKLDPPIAICEQNLFYCKTRIQFMFYFRDISKDHHWWLWLFHSDIICIVYYKNWECFIAPVLCNAHTTIHEMKTQGYTHISHSIREIQGFIVVYMTYMTLLCHQNLTKYWHIISLTHTR